MDAIRARPWLALFCFALALRTAYVLALYAAMGPAGLFIDDSGGYLDAAATMLRGGAWLPIESHETMVANTQFMPLYIWFLAAHEFFAGGLGPLAPALSQGLLDSATCLIVARLAALIDPVYRWPAGLLAAVNPTQIVLAGLILTEALFLFWCALALLAAVAWLRAPAWRWALLLGLALGMGIATRAMLLPWALVLPVLLALGTLLLRRFRPLLLVHLAVALALSLVQQAPVLARNYSTFGAFGLTSQGGAHALLWIVPLVRETVDGSAHAATAAALQAELDGRTDETIRSNPFLASRAAAALAFEHLADLGPLPLLKAFAYGSAINIAAPALILSPPIREMPRTGFYDTPGASKLDKIIAFTTANDNPGYAWMLILGAAGVLVFRLVQTRGVMRLVFGDGAKGGNGEKRVLLLLLLAWIGFVLVINGPISSPKYRQPAELALVVLAAAGLVSSRRRR